MFPSEAVDTAVSRWPVSYRLALGEGGRATLRLSEPLDTRFGTLYFGVERIAFVYMLKRVTRTFLSVVFMAEF